MLADVRISPSEITIRRGEIVSLTAYGILGCCSNFPWRVEFSSANPDIAYASGLLVAPSIKTEVIVTGRAPGTATIVDWYSSFPRATVHVICGEEQPIQPYTQRFVVAPMTPVRLAVTDTVADRMFSWYRGPSGDESHPLPDRAPVIDFTPNMYGTYLVWVKASTSCSVSTVEFRIDVPTPRRRAAR